MKENSKLIERVQELDKEKQLSINAHNELKADLDQALR
jgi:hypothetical protein